MQESSASEENSGDEAVDREEWVRHMKSNKHANGTKTSYGGKLVHFINYVYQTQPEVLSGEVHEFLRTHESSKSRRKFLFAGFARIPDPPMMKVDELRDTTVLTWLSLFKGREGKCPSKSVYGQAVSALVGFYKDHKSPMDPRLRSQIGAVVKGAKRQRKMEQQRGEVKMEEGKESLSFEMYSLLASELFKANQNNCRFLHTFLLMSWNLMCRASNTQALRMVHLKWEEDCLVVHLARHKSDQEGERTDPKRIYANPSTPHLCMILSLGIYFCVFGVPAPEELLFDGDRQYNRFVTGLQRFIEDNERVNREFSQRGIKAEDIAAHSTRKGARSHLTGGTTTGPSTPSILLRGGWALEGMDKHYVRHERAGDQYIGRILAGLDPGSVNFGVLPPHFERTDDISGSIRACFPKVKDESMATLSFCLASLVFHQDLLRRSLTRQDRLFQSPFFAQGIGTRLKDKVSLDFNLIAGKNEYLQATGIPSHVLIAREVKASRDEFRQNMDRNLAFMEEVRDGIATIPIKVKEALHEELEMRAVDSGTITRDFIERFGEDLVRRFGEIAHGPAPVNIPQEQQVPPAVQAQVQNDFEMWNFNGAFRRVPPDFVFPTKVNAKTLFQLYCLGNREMRIAPYKTFESTDFVTKELRARLSDIFALMGPLKAYLVENRRWVERPNPEQVEEMWNQACQVIAVPSKTEGGHHRRMRELCWTTQLNQYRKRAREADADDVG